jgi:hypothetical protein
MDVRHLITLLAAASFVGATSSSSAQLVSEVAHCHMADEPAEPSISPGEDYSPYEFSYGPTWTFGGDVVFMQRAQPDSLVLMHDTIAPARNLNANSFDFDFHTGWDVSLARENSGRGLEFRFLSVDGWDAATTAIAGGATTVRINNAVPFDVPGVTAVNAVYNSELLSAEFNLRRPVTGCCTLLVGFRYFELDEDLHADLVDAGPPSTYDTFTRNRMYGAQVGAEATLWSRNRLTLDGIGKVGIYHDSGRQDTTLDSGIATFTASDTSDRAAFAGELAVTGAYHLTDCLSLRANYSLLWLETVTLASDQIPATNFFTGGGIDGAGGAFYHGLLIGLVYQR